MNKRTRFPKGLLPGAGIGCLIGIFLEITMIGSLILLNHWPGYGYVPTWEQAIQRTFEGLTLVGFFLPLMCCSGVGGMVGFVVFVLIKKAKST